MKHIAAAASVEQITFTKLPVRLSLHNAIKSRELYIRAGLEHERKIYSSGDIVKNHLYQRICRQLCASKYFANVCLNPTPFGPNCGVYKKIEEN